MRRFQFSVYVIVLIILAGSMMASAVEIFPIEEVQPAWLGWENSYSRNPN